MSKYVSLLVKFSDWLDETIGAIQYLLIGLIGFYAQLAADDWVGLSLVVRNLIAALLSLITILLLVWRAWRDWKKPNKSTSDEKPGN